MLCYLNLFSQKKCQRRIFNFFTFLTIFFSFFRTVQQETFLSLTSLKTLKLHSNKWECDCKLQRFREFIVERKLYNRPTSCHEPARLFGKMWDEIQLRDFACKPFIKIINEVIFSSPGRNATMSCLVEGSPVPDMKWVNNGRIINNNTTPMAFSKQKHFIYESHYGYQKWYVLECLLQTWAA